MSQLLSYGAEGREFESFRARLEKPCLGGWLVSVEVASAVGGRAAWHCAARRATQLSR